MPPSSIIANCRQFLSESNGQPLYKMLPTNGEGFRRVKIRRKARHSHLLEKYFDMAFREEYPDLRLRSMVAHTRIPTDVSSPYEELFYVFPTDGYKVLFNRNLNDYETYLDSLNPLISSSETLVKDVIEYSFEKSLHIHEAIEIGGDVLVYNIQNYYAIRASLIADYNNFVTY